MRILISYLLTSVLVIAGLLPSFGQQPLPAKTASEIQHAIKKLQVLGSVLYVAAHPDDENTRLITYFAKGKGYRTRYLSLTRGDGGQNVIGNEKGIYLGMLRTQELLAARRMDGGEQMFSRAFDFGYSKNPEETLAIWDKDKVLSDVVWAMRKFKPDVIVTRFPGPEKGGGGHGHHTSSAMLAQEAFGLAGDPNAYPDQLKYVSVWQPKRLLWNSWYGFFGRRQATEEELKKLITIDIGGFDPLLGKSYVEIASEARSQHKCQAFGTWRQRGSVIEYLDHELGERAKTDLFEGVETSWKRVGAEKTIGKWLKEAYESFNPAEPEASIPLLLKAFKEMEGKEGYWYTVKREELREVISYCAGLWYEISSDAPMVATGEEVKLTASFLKRGNVDATLETVHFGYGSETANPNQELVQNSKVETIERTIKLNGLSPSQPYWLEQPMEKGLFNIDDRQKIGLPENPPALMGSFTFNLEGTQITFDAPVVHKYVDRAIGELYRPFVVAPKATVNISEKVYLFSTQTSQEVQLMVKSFAAGKKVRVEFEAPEGWVISPAYLELDFSKALEEKTASVQVRPPSFQSVGKLKARVIVDGESDSRRFQTIQYRHIPTQVIFSLSEARLVRVDLKKEGELIGYIMGSGDEVPVALEQIGYKVEVLDDDEITLENLRRYDAVIAGIRAYNRNKRMPFHQETLFKYVEEGGTYIVQYNTTSDLSTKQPGPYPLKLSRDRVSVEEAKVTFLKPDHPVLNFPNKITQADFEGWIQERGLYFPDEWDDRYEAITESNDPGESPKQGALLVANLGKGHFIYTGYSWFRELPAGVPGAYRIFANLISIGKGEEGR